jgi:hypothetical protein
VVAIVALLAEVEQLDQRTGVVDPAGDVGGGGVAMPVALSGSLGFVEGVAKGGGDGFAEQLALAADLGGLKTRVELPVELVDEGVELEQLGAVVQQRGQRLAVGQVPAGGKVDGLGLDHRSRFARPRWSRAAAHPLERVRSRSVTPRAMARTGDEPHSNHRPSQRR